MGKTPEISPIHLEREPFRVCLPPLRPRLGSARFYHNHEASGGVVTSVRDQSYCVSGRLIDYGRISPTSQDTCKPRSESIRGSGIFSELRKISLSPNCQHRISGVFCGFNKLNSFPPSRQGKEGQEGISPTVGESNPYYSGPLQTSRSPYLINSGCFSSPPPLPPLTGRQEQSFQHKSELCSPSRTKPPCKGGASLVEGQFKGLKWESSDLRGSRPLHRNRCFSQRVGSLLFRSFRTRSMVTPRANASYQLPRTPCWSNCSHDFCPKQSTNENLQNVSAVYYINKMGGTKSPVLAQLAIDLWQWCLNHNLVLNVRADRESRTLLDHNDWHLSPVVFNRINQTWGPLELDLFASRLSAQCHP